MSTRDRVYEEEQYIDVDEDYITIGNTDGSEITTENFLNIDWSKVFNDQEEKEKQTGN